MRATDLKQGDDRSELLATIALVRSKQVPARTLTDAIDAVGSAVLLLETGGYQWPGSEVIEEPLDADLLIAQAGTDIAEWESRGITVSTPLHANYPSNLREIFDRPALFFTLGAWDDSAFRNGIAVVGARKATPEGLVRARRLSKELCEAGFTIFSGLAMGIDTAAHRAALDVGGATVAVMGTGLDRRYPAENRDLADEIHHSDGRIVSQFLPAQGPTRWTFPMRNVVMSGLSLATVVVEASDTSGAKMQAGIALRHGRTVFLLQSLVESHQWARDYVTDGKHGRCAIPVANTGDILSRVNGHVKLALVS